MPRDLARILHCQQLRAAQVDHPHLVHAVDGSDARTWHFLIINLPPPYRGGEYIFRLRAPESFPQQPPELSFLTPNGVFEADGGKVCISIGEFHAHDAAGRDGAYGWRPVLGMIGFAGEVVNALIAGGLGGGVRVLEAPAATKAALAGASGAHNWGRHPQLRESLQAALEERPESRAAHAWRMWQAAETLATIAGDGAWAETHAELLVQACGPHWGLAAEGFWAAGLAPGAPSGPDAALLAALGPRLQEALVEREDAARRALLAGLGLRLLVETEAPAPQLEAAFAAFVAALAGAAGAWGEKLPPLVLAAGLGAFVQSHARLAEFLKEPDLDAQKELGAGLAASYTARAG